MLRFTALGVKWVGMQATEEKLKNFFLISETEGSITSPRQRRDVFTLPRLRVQL